MDVASSDRRVRVRLSDYPTFGEHQGKESARIEHISIGPIRKSLWEEDPCIFYCFKASAGSLDVFGGHLLAF